MIPRKLHTIWIGSNSPNVDFREKWSVFENWETTHWNDEMIKSQFYDDEFLFQLYKNEGPTKISDYVRMLILNRYGGVYCDIDTYFLKPIDDFLDTKAFTTYQFSKIKNPKKFLSKGLKLKDHFNKKSKISLFSYYNTDIYLNNSILGSIPNSKFLNTFLEVFKNDYKKPIDQRFSYVDYGSGPAMTTYVASLFAKLNGETVHTKEVSIYDNRYFHPCNYIENKSSLRTRDFASNIDKQIQKGIDLGSYCVHIQSSAEVDTSYRNLK